MQMPMLLASYNCQQAHKKFWLHQKYVIHMMELTDTTPVSVSQIRPQTAHNPTLIIYSQRICNEWLDWHSHIVSWISAICDTRVRIEYTEWMFVMGQ